MQAQFISGDLMPGGPEPNRDLLIKRFAPYGQDGAAGETLFRGPPRYRYPLIYLRRLSDTLARILFNQSPPFDYPSRPETPFRQSLSSDPEEIVQQSAFLSLPLDIVFTVLDVLNVANRFHLSQTCRALRLIVRPSVGWEELVSQMDPKAKAYFWFGIGAIRPSAWYCFPCSKLHTGYMDDVPSAELAFYQCTTHDGLRSHWIRPHHIQLTFKMAGLGSPYKEWREALLKPYDKVIRIAGQGIRRYSVQPKIVNGRFLVCEQWEHEIDPDSFPIAWQQERYCNICPHLGTYMPCTTESQLIELFYFDMGTTPSNRLQRCMRRAYQRPGEEIVSSCRDCANDFTVKLDKRERLLTLRSWSDYGGAWTAAAVVETLRVWKAGQRLRRPAEVPDGGVRDSYGEWMPIREVARSRAPSDQARMTTVPRPALARPVRESRLERLKRSFRGDRSGRPLVR